MSEFYELLLEQLEEEKDIALSLELFVNGSLNIFNNHTKVNVQARFIVYGTRDNINVVGVGTLNNVLIHPREVYKSAILSNASNIILAHNHPSGNPEPSRQDMDVTKRLAEAGRIMGIEVLDQ